MTLAECAAHIGEEVTYQDPFPSGLFPSGRKDGVITSVGDRFVFVRYGQDAYSRATRAEDLTLARDGERP